MSIDDRTDKGRPSAVEKYADSSSQSRPSRERPTDEGDNPEEMGPFYTREKEVRGPALALTLLLKNGNRFSIDYAHRMEMQFDADLGIEIIYGTGVKITIRGLYLGKLYDDLAQNMVLTIRSMDKLHAVNCISIR